MIKKNNLFYSPTTTLFIITFIFVGIGIIMVYSSSVFFAEKYFGNSNHFIFHHAIHVLLGSFLMLFSSYWPYYRYQKMIPLLLLLTFILLIIVLIPSIGVKISGARRWIRIANMISIQPAELAKFTILLWLSNFISRKKELLNDFRRGILPGCIIIGIYFFLLLLQPDFGSAALIVITVLVLLFIAGIHPLRMLFTLLAVSGIACLLIINNAYRMRRVLAFLDPWADRYDSGYQLISSFIAYSTGHLFGKGLGNSTQKLLYLPQAHTDFIFSILAEETGLIGVCLMLILFFIFACSGLEIAKQCQNEFGKNMATGITLFIILQAIIHICVVTGLVPTKGISLPFISYGGSSLLIFMFMAGILINISQINFLEKSK